MSAPIRDVVRHPTSKVSDASRWEGRAFGAIVLAAFLLYGVGSATADEPIGLALVVLNSIAVASAGLIGFRLVSFPVTILFLAWAWLRHHAHYVRIRNALIVTTGIGLVVHVVYSLKPPRMMNGFVDTAAVLGPDPDELGISGGANQLAAMPSLHVGWALLVALGVVATGTSNAKWLALLHPILTLAVVVITANHYWIDAVVAVAIVLAAWHITRPTHQTGHSWVKNGGARVGRRGAAR